MSCFVNRHPPQVIERQRFKTDGAQPGSIDALIPEFDRLLVILFRVFSDTSVLIGSMAPLERPSDAVESFILFPIRQVLWAAADIHFNE